MDFLQKNIKLPLVGAIYQIYKTYILFFIILSRYVKCCIPVCVGGLRGISGIYLLDRLNFFM